MSWKTEFEGTDELRYFTEITKIPRPSGHLDAIRRYLIDFAESHVLSYNVDEAGNLIVRRPGKGKTIVLQGHMDMVPTSVPGTDFDFVNQPLDTYIERGWMHARGTTLGADDGSGLALMLCALTDPALFNVSLECVFTCDEEIGLLGAARIKEGWITGKYLLNLDNEDVNEITIGSAGSTDIVATFSYDKSHDDGSFFCFEVSGLMGGHSAMAIDLNRGNAILMLAQFISRIRGVRIASFEGGSASNVIPMSARVVFSAPDKLDINEIFEKYRDYCSKIVFEPDMVITLTPCAAADTWSDHDSASFINAILQTPNGVLEKDEYGIRTSSNIGVVDSDCRVIVKPRSSDDAVLKALVGRICRIYSIAGADVPSPEVFPAWRESDDSKLVKRAAKVYEKCFNRKPKITVTHGGLESSSIKSKCPEMSAISIGPTIIGAHTPDERLDLRTLTEMKGYLFELIDELS